MIGKIIMSLMMAGCLNFLLTYLYRQEKLADSLFKLALVVANIISVYAAQVIMGVRYDSLFAIMLAVIGGISLGFQGAKVIIRARHLEKNRNI